MGWKSRNRLAADWFAKIRQNATTLEVEHPDVVAAEEAVENIDLTAKADVSYVDTAISNIEGVPAGCILMWSGSAAAIPSGWALCDGANGTPNLVGKFVKAGSTAGTTGGSNTHSHTHSLSAGSHTLSKSQMPSHNHFGGAQTWYTSCCSNRPSKTGGYKPARQGGSSAYQSYYYDGDWAHSDGGGSSHSHSLAGSIASGDNQPAYYELCYIMKV